MSENEIFQTVKKVTLEVLPFLPPQEITIEKSLKDLGANSIDRAEVVTRSLEELQMKVPLVEFGRVTNIQGLVKVLCKYTH